MATQLDAKHLANEFSPKLVELLEARKADIIASAGGMTRRMAVKMAWPTLIAEIPNLTETLVEFFIWKFGGLTVEELIEAIDSLKKSTRTRTDIPPIKP